MPKSATKQRKLRVLYCTLMDEIKLRTEIIGNTVSGTYLVPPRPAFELAQLQLRMICELIALACLAVHGDIPGTQSAKMRSAYTADFILNALEKLHPRFYPQPGQTIDHSDGSRGFIPADRAHIMSKDDLVKLYRKCGEHLHRGPFKAMQDIFASDFQSIIIPMAKITRLLHVHRIAFLASEDELWVSMRHPKTGKVRASLVRPG